MDFDDRSDEVFYDLCWETWSRDFVVDQTKEQFGFESALHSVRPEFVPN